MWRAEIIFLQDQQSDVVVRKMKKNTGATVEMNGYTTSTLRF
jgi:hypothetical protein